MVYALEALTYIGPLGVRGFQLALWWRRFALDLLAIDAEGLGFMVEGSGFKD